MQRFRLWANHSFFFDSKAPNNAHTSRNLTRTDSTKTCACTTAGESQFLQGTKKSSFFPDFDYSQHCHYVLPISRETTFVTLKIKTTSDFTEGLLSKLHTSSHALLPSPHAREDRLRAQSCTWCLPVFTRWILANCLYSLNVNYGVLHPLFVLNAILQLNLSSYIHTLYGNTSLWSRTQPLCFWESM